MIDQSALRQGSCLCVQGPQNPGELVLLTDPSPGRYLGQILTGRHRVEIVFGADGGYLVFYDRKDYHEQHTFASVSGPLNKEEVLAEIDAQRSGFSADATNRAKFETDIAYFLRVLGVLDPPN